MLGAIGNKLKETLGSDLYTGLMGMFLFLHFYYGVGVHGWSKAGLGLAAVVVATLVLSITGIKFGNGFRSAVALTTAALAIDFFYRGQVGQPATSLVFEYLWNGPVTVNFASFGFSSVWLFSQLDPRG